MRGRGRRQWAAGVRAKLYSAMRKTACALARVTYPDRTLADNDATMELLRKHSGGTVDELEEIALWGAARKARIDTLCRLAGLVDGVGVFGRGEGRMSRIAMTFTIHPCVAIASKHGLDMGYTFNDNEYGPFSPDLSVDLHAVEPVRVDTPTGIFPSDGAESAFLEDIGEKSAKELGEFARLLVIDERHRILL